MPGPGRHSHLTSRLAAMLYRRFIDRALAGVHGRVTRLLLETAPGPWIVDCCCGTGGLLRCLARSDGDGRALGVDLDPFALAQASGDLGPGQTLLRAEAGLLPLATSSVDGAAISHALHVMPHGARTAALGELVRIVRPGGAVIIADYDPDGSTSPLSRLSLFLIERLVGGDHYRNYRDYMDRGGCSPLLDQYPVERIRQFPIHRGGGCLWVCRVR